MTRTLVHTGSSIVPAAEAHVPVLDHGFLFGDSVYEVVRTAQGRPFMMSEHLDRMRASAALIYFDLPWEESEIARRIKELHQALGVGESYVRIIATRGPGPISLLPDGCNEPGLYVVGRELIRFPAPLYMDGCRVAIVHRLRNDPRALDPRAKTGNYLNNMLGLIEAKKTGADDALFFNLDHELTEATTSNVWIVEDGRIVTPPLSAGILQGITRGWVLTALPAGGIGVEEAPIGRERLTGAQEVFLTGTVKGVMPVTMIDGAPLGDGKPGPVTRRAMQLYDESLARN